jgi:hypothetical protein
VRKKPEDETMAFCKISFDLFCDKGNNPRYRIYVNNELFTERTYIWTGNKYVKENLQVEAPAGEYTISIEKVDPAKFRLRNTTVDFGPAEIVDSTRFRIIE